MSANQSDTVVFDLYISMVFIIGIAYILIMWHLHLLGAGESGKSTFIKQMK